MIEVQLRGFTELRARLNRLAGGLEPLATRIRARVVNMHQRRVATEKTDPDGRPWPPLAASTLSYKRGTMLVETSRLLGSFTSTQSGLTVTVSNQAIPYNMFHQFGTKRMPRRRFMGLGAKNITEIQQTCRNFILERLGG